MDVASELRRAREAAGLSKRALARQAGTSPAAIVAYEAGTRVPSIATLERLLAATGASVTLVVRPISPRADYATAGRRLAEVLGLAEHLPRRPAARTLPYPPFCR